MKIKLHFSLLLILAFFLANAATPPSATISYNSPFCQSSTQEIVTLIGTTGGTFSASPASLSINATTGTIVPSTSIPGTYTVTYFIPAGVDPAFSTTTTVTINTQPNAGVDGGVTVCESSTTTINLYSLISGEQLGGTWIRTSGVGGTFNQIAGTFLPSYGATNSTFDYTILGSNPCINDTSVAYVIVNQQPNAGTDGATTVCNSSTATIDLYGLITGEQVGGVWTRTSGTGGTFNAVAGTYTPAVDATTSTFTYTIAAAAPCINETSTATVVFGNIIQPQFVNMAAICLGATPPALPSTSLNGITGTWSPSVIDTSAEGLSVYTFTPDPNQCAITILFTINVANSIVPQFNFNGYNFCIGQVPDLPTISLNGITGSWTPAIITATGIYTFTPNAGQCATTRVETFVVSPMPTAIISGSTTVCEGNPATITFTGTPNSIVTYDVDGGTIQTIVLNASGMAVISTPVLNGGIIMYCLISATTGVGSCTTPLSGCATITVATTPIIPPIANVFSCQPYVLPPLTQGNYYTDISASGTMLHAGDVIDFSRTIYVFEENACYQNQISFNVSINSTPTITHLPDVTACQYYELPINFEAGYYTEPHGGGMHLSGNIYSSQTVYLYIATGPYPYCTAEDSFHVTIIPATNPEIISDNGTHYIYVDDTTIVEPLLLDSQLSGNYSYQWFNYFDAIPGATNATYLVDTYTAEQSWSIFVRATNLDTGCVTDSYVFWVYQSPVPAPTGDVNQTFSPGQTLANVVVFGQNIQWYDVMNRNAASNPLPLTTVLVEGVTYYATQTINGHESASAFEITIQFLSNDSFAFKDLKFNPNPVQDVLYISSKDRIKDVTVYNIMGQKILQQNFDSLDLRLPLSQLKAGNYFIKLESDNKSQIIKVIKE